MTITIEESSNGTDFNPVIQGADMHKAHDIAMQMHKANIAMTHRGLSDITGGLVFQLEANTKYPLEPARCSIQATDGESDYEIIAAFDVASPIDDIVTLRLVDPITGRLIGVFERRGFQ